MLSPFSFLMRPGVNLGVNEKIPRHLKLLQHYLWQYVKLLENGSVAVLGCRQMEVS